MEITHDRSFDRDVRVVGIEMKAEKRSPENRKFCWEWIIKEQGHYVTQINATAMRFICKTTNLRSRKTRKEKAEKSR